MHRRKREWSWRRVWWTNTLTPDVALRLVTRIATDRHIGPVAWEAQGSNGRVRHRVAVQTGHGRALNQLLSSTVPGLRIDASLGKRPARFRVAGRVGVSHSTLALSVDRLAATSRAVLAALSAATKGEAIVLQVLLGARTGPSMVDAATPDPHETWFDLLLRGSTPAGPDARASLKTRALDHGFQTTIRIGAEASSDARAQELLQGVLAALRVAESAGAHLTCIPDDPRKVLAATLPWRWPMRLSSREVTGLLGWPVGVEDDGLPGMPRPHPNRVAPQAKITDYPRPFAVTTAPGEVTRIGIGAEDSLQHTVILGPTASGKSTAMLSMIVDAMNAGRSVLVIDPKTDLVNDVLGRVPQQRMSDVVVLDPTAPDPVGLNPLSSAGRSPQVVADSILAVFKELFAESWGPRTQDILTAALLTLAKQPGTTLTMLPSLLMDEAFRRRMTRDLGDPIGLGSFWASYEAMSAQQRSQAIAPVMNKLRQFLLRPAVRTTLGQADPRFRLSDLFTQRKIVLVSLNKGLIGSEGARLIGALVVSQLWPLILARADVPAAKRHPVAVFIDEVQDYLALPTDLEDALSQARGLGVGFTLAHQYRRQLPASLRAGIDANARNKVIFGLPADDATEMAREAPGLSAQDFQLLPRFHIYLRLVNGGRGSGWFSARTLPAPPAVSDPVALKASSAHYYGRASSDVDREVLEAIGISADDPSSDGQIGRRPRPGGRHE